MRNGGVIAVLIFILLVAIGVWWWRSSASDPVQEQITEELTPELNVASARVTNISDDQINIDTEIIIENPFPVEMTSHSMSYEVFIDSIRVIKDRYEEPVRIRSSDSTSIELPMTILADPMSQVLDYFEEYNIDSAHYALEASIVLDVPIEGEEEFTMNISDTLPAIQLFEMELQEVETNILSSDDGIDVVIRITNPNVYPVRYYNGSFTLTIKDEMEVVGQIEDIEIPAGSAEDIAVHAEKEWGSLTQSALDFLFNQEDTQFTYHFNGLMKSENEMFNNTEVNLRIEGTLDELSDAAGL